MPKASWEVEVKSLMRAKSQTLFPGSWGASDGFPGREGV